MPLGSAVEAEAQDQTLDLIRTVDQMRPFVLDRMRGRIGDVDAVLQLVRETVWRRAHTYDPARGCPNAFVFGITRNVVRRELARRVRSLEALDGQVVVSGTPDPLQRLVNTFDTHRWMSLVADYVAADEWALVTEIALAEETAEAACCRHHLTLRKLRTIREHVAVTAFTVRAALAAADAGLPMTGSVILRCIPVQGGLREVAELLGQDAPAIADRLHIHPGSARARIATARKLVRIAAAVMQAERAA
jgi:DNA-directed RNA polymerase specialized sigma24 family protein